MSLRLPLYQPKTRQGTHKHNQDHKHFKKMTLNHKNSMQPNQKNILEHKNKNPGMTKVRYGARDGNRYPRDE